MIYFARESQLIEQMEAKALEEKAIRGLLKADFGLGSLSAKKTTVQMGGEKTDGKGNSSNSAPATATSIEETFQLVLGVEKYQCPELHFQPHITGNLIISSAGFGTEREQGGDRVWEGVGLLLSHSLLFRADCYRHRRGRLT